jgi:hypothetical protein
LEASDGAAGDRFGYSVSLDGGVALVGAPYADGNEPGSGAAYVFRLGKRYIPGQGFVVVWDQEAKLIAPEGKTDDQFGHAVALEGDLALVGAPNSNFCGQSYVFRRDGTWTLESTMTTSYPLEEFGYSADIHNGYAIVGAISCQGHFPSYYYYGHVFLFKRALMLPVGWVWLERAAFVMGLGTYPSLFPVAITDGRAVAGDPTAPGYMYDESYIDWMSAGNLGAVFTYQEYAPGWDIAEVLAPGYRQENDYFGSSLAISGDYMAVGIPGSDEDANDVGAVCIYRQLAGVWGKAAVLVPSGGGEGDWFGAAIGIDQGHIIVGSPLNDGVRKEDCGAAYIFRVCPTADSDGDCQVNFLDFAQFAEQWLQ